MSETRFHGARVTESTDLVTAINDVDSSVIGIVATADDADAELFPLNKPTLLTRVNDVLGKCGTKNVLGMSRHVFWSLQAEDSDANSLNNKEITTIIRRNGFRFWGNRTPETNAYIFEVYTRTAQVLADSIAEAQFETIDSPLTPANVKDVISAIRAKLDSLVTAGKLIGASCWYDVVDNSTTDLRQGRVRIRYKYTPVPPLEDMELYQTFTDEYFDPAFAVLGGV